MGDVPRQPSVESAVGSEALSIFSFRGCAMLLLYHLATIGQKPISGCPLSHTALE